MMTRHVLDEYSVINPATGKPWPLWAGDLPQEPDPRCVCSGEWLDDRCALENTFYGQSFTLQEELRAAFAAVRQGLVRIAKAWTGSRR